MGSFAHITLDSVKDRFEKDPKHELSRAEATVVLRGAGLDFNLDPSFLQRDALMQGSRLSLELVTKALYDLARVFDRERDHDRARNLIAKAAELEPSNPSIVLQFAGIASRGNDSKACKSAKAALISILSEQYKIDIAELTQPDLGRVVNKINARENTADKKVVKMLRKLGQLCLGPADENKGHIGEIQLAKGCLRAELAYLWQHLPNGTSPESFISDLTWKLAKAREPAQAEQLVSSISPKSERLIQLLEKICRYELPILREQKQKHLDVAARVQGTVQPQQIRDLLRNIEDVFVAIERVTGRRVTPL